MKSILEIYLAPLKFCYELKEVSRIKALLRIDN